METGNVADHNSIHALSEVQTSVSWGDEEPSPSGWQDSDEGVIDRWCRLTSGKQCYLRTTSIMETNMAPR